MDPITQLPRLTELLKDSFPQQIVSQRLELSVTKASINEKAKIEEKPTGVYEIYFHGAESNEEFNPHTCSHVCIQTDKIYIRMIGKEYLSFRETILPLLNVLSHLTGILNITQFSGLILRKLNLQPISSIIKDENLSLVEQMKYLFQSAWLYNNENTASKGLISSLTKLFYNEDDHHLHLIYGILPVEEGEQSRFLLDITVERFKSCVLTDVSTALKELNDQLFDIFEAFISEKVKTEYLKFNA
jgi:hypothetical protein